MLAGQQAEQAYSKHPASIASIQQASECQPASIQQAQQASTCLPASIQQASNSRVASSGGFARSQALSPERRREIAQHAAVARWKKVSRKVPIGFVQDFQHD